MLKLIVATDKNGVIGSSSTNDIPWKCREDMQFFKTMTTGHGVIMGRKTWESIPEGKNGKLPHRIKMVICHNPDEYKEHVDDKTLFVTYEDAIKNVHHMIGSDAFVIGGASIYKMFSPLCAIHYVTKLDIEVDTEDPVYFHQDNGDMMLASSSKRIVTCNSESVEMDQQVWLNTNIQLDEA